MFNSGEHMPAGSALCSRRLAAVTGRHLVAVPGLLASGAATCAQRARSGQGSRCSVQSITTKPAKALLFGVPSNRRVTSFLGLVTGASRSAAKRDLEDLVEKGLLVLRGAGRGAYYETPRKRPRNGPNGPPEPAEENGS